MNIDVTTFREIKNMEYREMKKFFDKMYREAFKDGRNSVFKEAEELGVNDLQVIKAEVE